MDRYTIGEASRRSGFTASALRYYETHGLLAPVGRTGAGYRLYDDSSLDRLQFIGRAKELGCTIEEVTALAELWAAGDCGPVQVRLHELVTTKIADAQRRSGELIRFIAQLQIAAAHLGREPLDGPCGDGCACLGGTGPAAPAQPVVLAERVDPAIACTLPVEAMLGRAEEGQAVLAHVEAREPLTEGVGVRLVLDAQAPVGDVARLAVAEQGCCSFFAFAITIDHRGVALEVRAPDDAIGIVTAMFGAAP